MNELFDLRGKVAIVTGGTSGIGRGYARGLARCGATVAVLARDASRFDELTRELTALGAPDVRCLSCDVSSESAVTACIEEIVFRFGRIDACFANAGKAKTVPFLESTIDQYRSVNAVNFEGMYFCFREAARHMKQHGGKLIATSSTAASHGSSGLLFYCASKGAVEAAVRALAVELAPYHIQVNAVVPGVFRTGMTARSEQLLQTSLERIPSTFIGQPQHVEGLAAFLASGASDYMTGASLHVDGGLSVCW